MKRFFHFLLCILLLCAVFGACSSEQASETPPASGTEAGMNTITCGDGGHPTAHFDSYRDFLSGIEAMERVGDERYYGGLDAYLLRVQNDPGTVLVPHQNGTPVVLREDEGLSKIAVMDRELYGLLWVWFFTEVDGKTVTICISELTEEYAALASNKTASEFIAAVAPGAPNVNNYQSNPNYSSVFTRDIMINGVSYSVLVKQATDGREYFSILMDGYLVNIFADAGIVTDEWLAGFSLAPYSE